MSLDSLVAIFISVAVFEMMAAVGLGVAVRDAVAVATNGPLRGSNDDPCGLVGVLGSPFIAWYGERRPESPGATMRS
jgi:hypothetical protein